MLLICGVREDSWESLGLQGDPTSPSYRRSFLGVHWKDWFWSWNSITLATWCEELIWRPWFWERLRVGGECGDRGWDGWMASLTQWTWVWVNSGSWWWTGRPGVLQSVGLQRVGHDWTTSLNLKTSRGVFFLSPSDVYVRSFLYPFYTLIKLLHKSSEQSSLISGPRLNSSPPEAKNPGVFRGSATTFQGYA